MERVKICADTYDLDGVLEFEAKPDSEFGRVRRRVSRIPTLDGGVAINDRGYAEGDRTITYRYKPVSAAHDQRAQQILKTHTRVRVPTRDGVYLAAPSDFTPGPDENTFTFLVISAA